MNDFNQSAAAYSIAAGIALALLYVFAPIEAIIRYLVVSVIVIAALAVAAGLTYLIMDGVLKTANRLWKQATYAVRGPVWRAEVKVNQALGLLRHTNEPGTAMLTIPPTDEAVNNARKLLSEANRMLRHYSKTVRPDTCTHRGIKAGGTEDADTAIEHAYGCMIGTPTRPTDTKDRE
jgi:hypothetical protein